MNTLFLDIETLPADPKLWAKVAADKELRYELKKKKPFNKEEAYKLTSLNGSYGQIFCIGYLKDPLMKTADIIKGEEKEILKDFWEIAKDCSLFVGHNVMDFDLPFIYKRSIVHKIRPSLNLSFARYRSSPIFDTMREWEKWNTMSRISMDDLAKILGLPSSKTYMDGSQVYEYWQKGKAKEIYEYCQADVEVNKKIYDRMMFK